MNTPVFNRPISARALGSKLRVRLAAEDGLSIVEVAVSGLLVGLIALSLIGLDAAGHTAQDQRGRAQAFAVAQADQERIKGLSADQIANLNQTRTVTLDGDAYTVTSTGQFLNSAANTASCVDRGGRGRLREDHLDRRLAGQPARRRRDPEHGHAARRRRPDGADRRPEREPAQRRAGQRRRAPTRAPTRCAASATPTRTAA